uniref:Uncharacterized protein n=1 Tax=Arundo donax TaxID=35708 RepID=A0A0A8ZKS7_ARUDO
MRMPFRNSGRSCQILLPPCNRRTFEHHNSAASATLQSPQGEPRSAPCVGSDAACLLQRASSACPALHQVADGPHCRGVRW